MIRLAAILAILLPGTAMAWDTVEGSKRVGPSKGDFSLQVPEGWLFDSSRHSIEASHDGPGLNHLTVSIPRYKDVFKNTKKVPTPNTSPQDLAEDYIAEIQSGPNPVRDLVVVSNDTAELTGQPAFRVHLRYRAAVSAGDATMESLVIGAALTKGVMLVIFDAPSLHYFERWAAQFDQAATSIALTPAPKD